MPRKVLAVDEATNEGSRALRALLRRLTLGQLARMLKCTPSTVRKWAVEIRTPTAKWRERLLDELGIPLEAWERRCTPRSDVREGDTRVPPTPQREIGRAHV